MGRMARRWREDRGSRSVGTDDDGGFGRWGGVRQMASVVLMAAIIAMLGVVALTGGAVVPERQEAEEPARVLGASVSATAPVPLVEGLPQIYAMEVLRKAGFTGVVSVSRPDEVVGKGKIANQIPAAGQELERGSEVELALSLGPEDRPVPDVVGYPASGALTLLERAGMNFATQVEPAEQAPGTVLRTQPAAGERHPKGTIVVLVLSSGPPPSWEDLLAMAGFDVEWLLQAQNGTLFYPQP